MFRKVLFASGLTLFLFFTGFQVTHAYIFSRNVRLGDRGLDVKELQKVLNASEDTKISSSGSGSPGLETTFFGSLTEQAVKRFQEKYRSDILEPGRLFYGNGYVGPLTRRKLNSLPLSGPIPIDPTTNPSNTAQNSTSLAQHIVKEEEKIDIYSTDKSIKAVQDEITRRINTSLANRASVLNISDIMNNSSNNVSTLLISKITPQLAQPGTNIIISGRGFDQDTVIYIGNSYIVRNFTRTSVYVSFTLPPLPPGKYDIVVKNNDGISNSTYFIVASNMVNAVSVESISPQTVPFNSTVTVRGSGFTSENNEVHTALGILKGLSSNDGKTLSFTYKPDMFIEMSKLSGGARTLPMQLTVVNNNGYTQPASFVLSY